MPKNFDPYYQWLGIPPEEQPPHHYRLLGIKPLEDNLDVIETAADRQMKHLRDYQAGKHAEHSQKLLNEIAAARIALLDPAKKQAYDAALRAKLDTTAPIFEELAPDERPLAQPAPLYPNASVVPRPQQPLPVVAPLASPVAAANDITFRGPSVQRASPMAVRRRSNSTMILVAGGAVALVLLAVVAAIVLSKVDDDELAAQDPSTNTGVESTASGNTSGKNNLDKPPAAILPRDRPTSNPPDRIADPVDEPAKEPIIIVAKPKPPQERHVLPPKQPAKLPVPEKTAREAKRQEILSIFPIADARTPDAKQELAEKLIATAHSSQADVAAQFALLNLAREQAAEAGQLELAFEVIDLLAQKFDFDADAVRVISVQQASKAVVPPATKREIVVTGMSIVEELVAADNFDDAEVINESMLTLARPLRDNEFTKSIVERRRELSDQAASYRRVRAAFDTLKKSPHDPDANLAVGRYLTFVKQDWDAGLKFLAKGSDTKLAAAAKGELALPETSANHEELADAWWDAAESQKDAKAQAFGRARAGYWYRQIVDRLVGLAKAKAEQRIQVAGAIDGDLSLPTGASLLMPFEEKDFSTIQNIVSIEDRSGNANRAVGSKVVVSRDGVAGSCLGCTGGTLDLPKPLILGKREYTFTCWFKADKTDKDTRFYAETYSGGFLQVIGLIPDGSVRLVTWNEAYEPGGTETSQWRHYLNTGTPTSTYSFDDWHFLAVTLRQGDIGRGVATVRLDSLQYELKSQATSYRFNGRATLLGPSNSGGVGGAEFKGMLDELAIYPNALTELEIEKIYQRGLRGMTLVD